MDYNSSRSKLALPEYGRNVQNMVNHALTIEDSEERSRCAKSIIGIMGNMFPHLRDVPDFKHKLWDHLAIMADFKLEIDFPYDLPEREKFNVKPDRVPYPHQRIQYLHYGKIIDELIQKAIEMEEGNERHRLVTLIANHMKKSFLVWNKDAVSDDKIFKDLEEMSKGQIKNEPEKYRLFDARDIIIKGKRRGRMGK